MRFALPAPTPNRYSLESLAAEFGITRRQLIAWREQGIISPAKGGTNARWRYFDDSHAEEVRAVLAIEHNNATKKEIAAYCREAGITVVEYVRQRGLKSHA